MKNAKFIRNTGRAVLFALLSLATAFSGGTAHAAGLLVADGGFGGVLEIIEHDVHVTINNGVAVTEVTQIFKNMENRQVEALYTFPVPAKASVSNFSMIINGKEMIGEVVEKERARQIYNSYKRRRKDPGLLEQTDYRTFEMRIFPIAPHAEQQVQLAYYQELNHDNDWATYVYPLATATRPQINSRVNGKFAMTIEAVSEVPIVEALSVSHKNEFVFSQHGEGFFEGSLEATEGSLSRDVVIAYHLSRPKTGVDTIFSRINGEDGFFCMTITAGEELKAQDVGMDYVFVLDISGSMNDGRKLETSSNSVHAFIDALGEKDRFELMAFNIKPETLFGALQPVDETTVARAGAFLNTQNAKGGTVIQPAMRTAYKYADPAGDRTLNVILLSDGLTKQADRAELLQIIAGRPKNARVFCIGVGNDVNRPLLEQMAEDSGGLAAMISRGDDFDRQAQAFRRKLTHPVATNVRVNFAGGDVYGLEPAVLPNLYHGAPIRLYGRYKDPGDVPVEITADLNGYGFDQKVSLALPRVDERNPEIERMWAWHQVQRLQKEADRTGSRDAVIDEIVRLGEGFSIASEYTSFLVLENDAEFKRWKIERRNALRIDRDRSAQRKLRGELDALRTASLDGLGPVQNNASKNTTPQVVNRPGNAQQQQRQQPQNRDMAKSNSNGQGWDFNVPSGGAIDPITGSIAIGLGGMMLAARRKKK